MEKKLVAIDLFCGIGGLTYGLQKTGIKVVAGIDSDPSCKYAYEKNNNAKFIEKNIKKVTGKELNKLYPKGSTKVLVGCAPCQPFSQHTLKHNSREKDERWSLLKEFSRLIKEVKPQVISMENVPQLKNHKVFKYFCDSLEEENYVFGFWIVNCQDYGVAQRRKRLVLLASKKGQVKLISQTHRSKDYVSVKDMIGNLPKIKSGEVDEKDKLHKSVKFEEKNMSRIRQSKPGGTWYDWDENLKSPCHLKLESKRYGHVYGRMSWDKSAPTLTTCFYQYSTGRFGHPEQDRAISLREGALLQSFPKSYKFYQKEEDLCFKKIGKHIGNAVPPKLAKAIGKSINLLR